jgi:HEPN domain-containing protein
MVQAGEKALKSCLYARAEDPPKRLDRFYIPTRYPNGLPGGLPFQTYSAKDLQEAIDDLTVIFEVCSVFLTRRGIDIS